MTLVGICKLRDFRIPSILIAGGCRPNGFDTAADLNRKRSPPLRASHRLKDHIQLVTHPFMKAGRDGIVFELHGWLWRLYVVQITPVRDDWFIQFTALGPRACAVFVRTNKLALQQSAEFMISRIRDAMSAHGTAACVLVDLLGG
jgi:hypothetical protein